MDHGLDIERKVRDGLVEIGRKLGIPPVVTNDSHYTREADATHTTCCCAFRPASPWPTRTGSVSTAAATTSSPPTRCTRPTPLTSGRKAAATASLLIADRVDTTGMFDFVNLMPRFPIPAGYESEEALFRAEVWKGMDRRYPDGYDEERKRQAGYEIDIICQMGFPAYFLVVADFIMWARTTASRSAGPRLGGRLDRRLCPRHHRPGPAGARPDLRAVPQPRARVHADIDVDSTNVAGRRHPLRDREVGLGQGRADRTYGTIKARPHQRTPPGSWASPTRSVTGSRRRSRPRSWARTVPLSGIFDSSHPRYNEAGELRQLTRLKPRSSRSSTRPGASRG